MHFRASLALFGRIMGNLDAYCRVNFFWVYAIELESSLLIVEGFELVSPVISAR